MRIRALKGHLSVCGKRGHRAHSKAAKVLFFAVEDWARKSISLSTCIKDSTILLTYYDAKKNLRPGVHGEIDQIIIINGRKSN